MQLHSRLPKSLAAFLWFVVFAMMTLLTQATSALADPCYECHLFWTGTEWDFSCDTGGDCVFGGTWCQIKYDKKGNVLSCEEKGKCICPV